MDKREGQIYLRGQVENEKLKKWCDGRSKAHEEIYFTLFYSKGVILV